MKNKLIKTHVIVMFGLVALLSSCKQDEYLYTTKLCNESNFVSDLKSDQNFFIALTSISNTSQGDKINIEKVGRMSVNINQQSVNNYTYEYDLDSAYTGKMTGEASISRCRIDNVLYVEENVNFNGRILYKLKKESTTNWKDGLIAGVNGKIREVIHSTLRFDKMKLKEIPVSYTEIYDQKDQNTVLIVDNSKPGLPKSSQSMKNNPQIIIQTAEISNKDDIDLFDIYEVE